MSILLFITTIFLCLSSISFTAVYIWINFSTTITDVGERNSVIIKILRNIMVLSIVFTFLACLLSSSAGIHAAIIRSVVLYYIIAVCWLLIIIVCGISMLVAFAIKSPVKAGLAKALKKLLFIAIWGMAMAGALGWLFG